MFKSLAGTWNVNINGKNYDAVIPGTLDENCIGGKDELLLKKEGREFVKAKGPVTGRLSRKYFYMGEAVYSRTVSAELLEGIAPGKRVFLEVTRSRALSLFVDGERIEALRGTLVTPYIFELTGRLKEDSRLELVCDNTYKNMPASGILYSSAATDETQTNWNGLIGNIGLNIVPETFIEGLRVYPKKDKVEFVADVSFGSKFSGKLLVKSNALAEPAEVPVEAGKCEDLEVRISDIGLREDVIKWDEYEGNLYECEAVLFDSNGIRVHSITRNFGIRDFGHDDEGRLTINERRFFLRGEANCAEFPEEGHWPMETERWLDIMEKYKSYGINCVRFHSHCPPEAAFEAADRVGMMVQPELSHWNPVDAFLPEHSYEYYKKELSEIIKSYANHPSFVMLTLGNELHSTEDGVSKMESLLNLARSLDTTRLYAWGSNNFYGEKGTHGKSDFYTSSDFRGNMLRATSAGMKGHINEEYPSAAHNYSELCGEIRKEYSGPVFGFEVGQYEILPDFDEIEEFKGISDPVNYKIIRKRAEEKGEAQNWKKYVEACGENALMCYREEVEAVLRTPEMSGLSLLGIQDFPGQGTALVGMMNSHMEPKPYGFAAPERFQSFFSPVLPMLILPKYTYTFNEIFSCDLILANYGKEDLAGSFEIEVTEVKSGVSVMHQMMESRIFPMGEVTTAGKVGIRFSMLKKSLYELGIAQDEGVALKISVYMKGGDKAVASNSYKIWVYPDITPVRPAGVHETKVLDEEAVGVLARGGIVYLIPDPSKESLPHSIKAQFSTDFWSVGTFDFQEGGMGQFIDEKHPIFKKFPTKSHSEWQWWPMALQRAVFVPGGLKCIVKEMDSYSYLRPMAQLFECRCLSGRVLFSSMGLGNLQKYPEAKALSYAIYSYLESEDFCPENVLEIEELKALFD